MTTANMAIVLPSTDSERSLAYQKPSINIFRTAKFDKCFNLQDRLKSVNAF